MKKNGKFILLTRAEFKDWINNTKFSRKMRRVQNHHTYLPDYNTFRKNKKYFSLVKNMEYYHVHTAKFSQIAQNITTFPDGMIMICRSMNRNPAGIKGANTGGICVEHIGNFDNGKVNSEHQKTVLWVNAVLCERFNLTPNTTSIVYHHWYDLRSGKRKDGKGTTKTCPGRKFFGGNSVSACKKYFIPRVIDTIKNMNKKEVKVMEKDQTVSNYAKAAVALMKELQIMIGDEKGNFNPKDPITRQDLAVVAMRIIEQQK